MLLTKKINLFYLCSLLFFLSCNHATKIDNEITTIVAGTSKITGKITTPDGMNRDSIKVTITVVHPISGEHARHEALADQSGNFSLDFDVEIDTTYIGLRSSLDPYKTLMVKSINGTETKIDLNYDGSRRIKFIKVSPDMSLIDMTQSMDILNKMINYRPNDPNSVYPRLFDKTIDEFLNYVEKTVTKRLNISLEKNNSLSKEFKGIVAKDLRLFIYTPDLFRYEEMMKRNYSNSTQDRAGKPVIQKIDRSYFRFLKDFNLNDPQYLHTFTFPEFQNLILENEILGLPIIGESDIPSWLTSVKAILADLVGFDDGPYYDILAANAFARQLNEEAKPLTDKQKENIADYWKNGEIAKILLRKNERVVELDKVKSPIVVNDIQSVPKEKVMEAIVSKYKDKVVLIDLWATWCAPCLDAIKQFSAAKADFHDKDVVFVYITDGSSPKKLWEEKIKGIGSEHYYLTGDQWEYMMEHFNFEYIPSYLLYNKEGLLVNKFSTFPGNDAVTEMLNGQLN